MRKFKYFRGMLIVLLGTFTATFCNALEQSELDRQHMRNMFAPHFSYPFADLKFSNLKPEDLSVSQHAHPNEISGIMKANGYTSLEERRYGTSFGAKTLWECESQGGDFVYVNELEPRKKVNIAIRFRRGPIMCKFKITDIIQAENIQEQ